MTNWREATQFAVVAANHTHMQRTQFIRNEVNRDVKHGEVSDVNAPKEIESPEYTAERDRHINAKNTMFGLNSVPGAETTVHCILYPTGCQASSSRTAAKSIEGGLSFPPPR